MLADVYINVVLSTIYTNTRVNYSSIAMVS